MRQFSLWLFSHFSGVFFLKINLITRERVSKKVSKNCHVLLEWPQSTVSEINSIKFYKCHLWSKMKLLKKRCFTVFFTVDKLLAGDSRNAKKFELVSFFLQQRNWQHQFFLFYSQWNRKKSIQVPLVIRGRYVSLFWTRILNSQIKYIFDLKLSFLSFFTNVNKQLRR